jgi:pimeloyl-ACP methyl ester carboxylesterase
MPRVPWDEHVRTESSAEGLPPLLVIQGGPGFPLLNERRLYRRLLSLEDHFSVCYWDRSGAGLHSPPPGGLGLEAHVGETVALLEHLARASGRKVMVLGVSIGGTLGLLASQRVPEAIDRVVPSRRISTPLEAASRARADHAAVREPRWQWLARRRRGFALCLDPAQFKLRATLLGHLGSLEAGASYGTQLRCTVLGIAGTYGPIGFLASSRTWMHRCAHCSRTSPGSTSSPAGLGHLSLRTWCSATPISLPARGDRQGASAAGAARHDSNRSRGWSHGTLRRPGVVRSVVLGTEPSASLQTAASSLDRAIIRGT